MLVPRVFDGDKLTVAVNIGIGIGLALVVHSLRHGPFQEPVGLGDRRLRNGLSGPFFTGFLSHS